MPRELDIVLDLARRAGDAILDVYAGEFAVEEKEGDEGPVTIADHRSDRLIRDGLRAAFPNDALLSEESPDDLVRLGRKRVWLVDPLDGTRQFVRRAPEFAVLIGLSVDGRSVLGVVHLPCEELTYVAADGEGAREIDSLGRARPLRLEPLPRDGAGLTVVVSRTHYGQRTRRAIASLAPRTTLFSGSVGRKAALVASGRADLYLTLGGRSRHWDACAPDAIVREAGGVFRDARGAPLVYNTEATQNRHGLLACRSGLMEAALAATEAALAEES